MNRLTGAELFFKCENFQKAGAFKVRGASNAVFGLSVEDAERGVATHSSGNHALSLSYAAGRRGIPCNVVMPRTAHRRPRRPPCGAMAARSLNASRRPRAARRCLPRFTSAYRGRFCPSLQRPPCHRRSGHLFAGVDGAGRRPRRRDRAYWWRRHGVGLLPDACPTSRRGWRFTRRSPNRPTMRTGPSRPGRIIADDAPVTIADGLKVPLKENTWHFVSTHVTDILTASARPRSSTAMKLTWQRMKIVMEAVLCGAAWPRS